MDRADQNVIELCVLNNVGSSTKAWILDYDLTTPILTGHY